MSEIVIVGQTGIGTEASKKHQAAQQEETGSACLEDVEIPVCAALLGLISTPLRSPPLPYQRHYRWLVTG